jgi:fluoride exporter
MTRLLLVMLGGALGSAARYGVGLFAASALPRDFPYGTWLVNLIGSFLLGALAQVVRDSEHFSPDMRLFLAVGVLGGFTTYSSFNQELLERVQAGALGAALGYVALVLLGCLAAGALGMLAARTLWSA